MKKFFSRSNNKLILLLVLVSFIFLGYPLVVYGIDKSFFYSIDPDIVYLTNALLYTKVGIISYMDHPGTPTIMLLYYSLIPLRLIAKFILHQGFIQWSFDNFALLFCYARVFNLLISSIALWLFLKITKSLSDSKLVLISAFIMIFSFSGLTKSISIIPENFSFLLTVIWLSLFVKFIKTNKYFLNALMTIVSGFTFANKFTAAFLLIPSIFLPIFIRKENWGNRIILVEANITIAVQSFLVGILPIISNLGAIVDWGKLLFNHAGTYGTGVASSFDWGTYSASFLSLMQAEPARIIFIGVVIILGIYSVVRRKVKMYDPVVFLTLTSIVGFFVFARYPIIRYNYVNLSLIIFCGVYYLAKIEKIISKILLPILVVVLLMTARNYIQSTHAQLNNNAESKVYKVIEAWTPFWSLDLYRKQLDSIGYFAKP